MAGWKNHHEEGSLDEEDLWCGSHNTPEDEETREIKALFDTVVGPQYLTHAYSPDADVSRSIWRAAHQIVGNSWTSRQLEDLYKDWKVSQDRTRADSGAEDDVSKR